MRHRRIGSAIVAAIALGAAGFAYLKFFQPREVPTASPTRGIAVEAVYATGTVEPLRYARVGAKVSGRVTAVLVAEGDAVAAGRILATIDSREEAARVEELAARLAIAADELARTRTLSRAGHVSAATLDQSFNSYSAAAAALQGAQARLDERAIAAPLGGQVLRSEERLKLGDMVQAGQVLFLVGDPTALQIDAAVDEEDVAKVTVGQEALIRADAFSGQALAGTVSGLTPFGDPVARSYRITIALPGDTPLRSGMTTEINVVVRREDDALLVPVAALAGDSVWLVVDGRARRRAVELGALGKTEAEVDSGLSLADVVIVNPPSQLAEGERVRVRRIPAAGG